MKILREIGIIVLSFAVCFVFVMLAGACFKQKGDIFLVGLVFLMLALASFLHATLKLAELLP